MNFFQNTLAPLILMSVTALSATQKLSEDEYLKTMTEVNQHYEMKNWPAALQVLDRLLAMTEGDENRNMRASVLYNKACMLTLANKKAEAIKIIAPIFKNGSDSA